MKKIAFLTVLLFGLITQKSNAQSSTAFNVYGGSYYLGWSSGGNALPFETAGVPQMSLLGTGDLNIIGGGNGYQIAGSYVLWNNNINSNIYVGVGAGNLTGPGIQNTFVGYEVGNAIGTGARNAAMGYQALS